MDSVQNVSCYSGHPALMSCIVTNLGNYTVSWIYRQHEGEVPAKRQGRVVVISSGKEVFSSDHRWTLQHSGDAWILHLENSSFKDIGLYECQINTDPKMNIPFYLSVSDPPLVRFNNGTGFKQTLGGIIQHEPTKPEARSYIQMTITGGSIQHYRVGQSISLVCRVQGLVDPPLALYWERGHKVVTAKHRPGSVLETEKLSGVSRVSLYISSVELTDTGFHNGSNI